LEKPNYLSPGAWQNSGMSLAAKNRMARKMNSLRVSQNVRGLAVVSNRQPVPPTAALYLAQLRPQILKVPTPRQRQRLTIQMQEQPQSACVVKMIQPDSF
jgi:hypothetical protein